MRFSFSTTAILGLIGGAPLLIVLLFSSYFLFNTYDQYINTTHLTEQLNKTQYLGRLSGSLARERGLSGVYLGSEGELVGDLIRTQYNQTDKSIEELQAYLEKGSNSVASESILKTLKAISAVRESVLNLSADFDTVFFDFYSAINARIIDEIKTITTTPATININLLATALASLHQDIESTGQERGFISHILTQKHPIDNRDMQIWMKLQGKASSFSAVTLPIGFAKTEIEQLYALPQHQAIFNQIEEAKAQIAKESGAGSYSIEPTVWFGMLTGQISVMEEASTLVKTALSSATKEYGEKAIWNLGISATIWALSLLFIFTGLFLRRRFKYNISELESVFDKIKEISGDTSEINLETSEGTLKAYHAIDLAIQTIAEEKKRAEEASAAKSIFLANMSHEIRTPLNGIIGFTELLKNSGLDDERKEFVDVIEKSSENLLGLINNILDLSKIESSKTELDEAIFSPIEEFENAITVYSAKAAEKQIDLQCYLDPSLVYPLKGDITKIKEVLINLLSNAVKFTQKNGTIDVQIKRSNTQSKGLVSLYFCVKDSGIGIAPEKQVGIFDAFSQADSTITRKYGGTGLGLTISSRFVEMLGGSLQVKSEIGEGSAFSFTLEFAEIPTPQAVQTAGLYKGFACALLTKKENSGKTHISYMYDYLNYFGVEVKFYTNFQELRNHIYKSGVTLIIADYALLSKEEIEEYKKIHLPVLLIIDHSNHNLQEKLKDNYITPVFKPLVPTKLTKWLSSCKASSPNLKLQPSSFIGDSMAGHFDAHVLVAEDNEINQKLIRRTLEDLGLKITSVVNGQLAVEAYKKGSFDLIFMDIAMPIMDGVEATKKILEYEKENNLPHTPIIAITANALKGDRERFMQEGLDEYVTKPVKREHIQAILSQFLYEKAVSAPKIKPTPKSRLATIEAKLKTDLEIRPIPDVKIDSKSVLIFKKNSIETKIFTSVLRKIYPDAQGAESLHAFKEALTNGRYAIIMIDDNIPGASTSSLVDLIHTNQSKYGDKVGHIVLFQDTMNTATATEGLKITKAVPNVVSKTELENLLQTLINEEIL